MLDKEEILEQLYNNNKKVINIIAPRQYGKTSLLSELAAACALDDGNNAFITPYHGRTEYPFIAIVYNYLQAMETPLRIYLNRTRFLTPHGCLFCYHYNSIENLRGMNFKNIFIDDAEMIKNELFWAHIYSKLDTGTKVITASLCDLKFYGMKFHLSEAYRSNYIN